MIYGSVCSGIEAASVAWHTLGWRPAFFSEIDRFPRAVLAHHFPEVPLHGDFTTIEAGRYPAIDLLVGGTPCQDFSVAGLRAGLAGERGNLTLEYLRLAGRLRPKWLVWENVPGVLSSDGGRALGAFLGGLAELGYGFAWRVLDAQYVRVDGLGRAVPQRRRRVFVVGYLGDWRRAAAVLFERESLCGNPAPRREAAEGVAATISARTEGGGGLGTDFDCDGGLITSHDPAVTLTAREKKGPLQEADLSTVVAHALRGEGFDASEDGTGRGVPIIPFDTTQLTSVNNRSRYAPGDPCHSLSSQAHPPAIAFSAKDHGADALDDLSPTLRAGSHSHSHANVGVMPAIAFAVRGREEGAIPEISGDIVSTLRGAAGGSSRDMIAYGIRSDADRAGEALTPSADAQGRIRLRNPGMGVYEELAPTLDAARPHSVATRWAVRRLTPRECERLQGFPDDFTLVPVGKKLAADGPRYKALGNSMAVNVMRWIGMRISRVEAMHNQFGEAA